MLHIQQRTVSFYASKIAQHFRPAGHTELTIPETVKTIAENACEGCKKLTEVVIPADVEKLKQVHS